MITEISSYDRFNDLFRLNIEPIYDSDHEYTNDYTIDSIKWIRWDLILKENGIEPDIDLIFKLEDEISYHCIFELEVNYNRYDASIKRIFVSDYWINKINEVIGNFINETKKTT